jgi:hypothetical protein
MIKIKKMSLAKRCEICHKSDCFDLEKEVCQRCEKLIIKSDNNKFIVDWQCELSVLASTLRTFTWENIDPRAIKFIRIAFLLGFFCSIIFLCVDYKLATSIDAYYIPPLPGSQTEEFAVWGLCGAHYYTSLEEILMLEGLIYLFGMFVALLAWISEPFSSSNFQAQPNLPKRLLNL